MKNKKLFIFLLITFYCSLIASYAEVVNKVVARVNNQVITTKDLDDYCKVLIFRLPDERDNPSSGGDKFKEEALEKLIEDKLILDAAKKEGFQVPSLWIASKLDEIIASYPTIEEFENSLIERGLNITLLRARIKEQYLLRQALEKYVHSQITISPQEISRYYESNSLEFSSQTKFILWIAKSIDENFLRNLGQTIKEKGISQAEKEHQGSIIKIESAPEELKEEILQILKTMQEGEYSIKEIDNLSYLIYLEEIVASEVLSIDAAGEEIYSYLWEKKFKVRFSQWLEELKGESVIRIYK